MLGNVRLPLADKDCEMLNLCSKIGLKDTENCKAEGNLIHRCKPGDKVQIKLLHEILNRTSS